MKCKYHKICRYYSKSKTCKSKKNYCGRFNYFYLQNHSVKELNKKRKKKEKIKNI